MTTDPTKDTVLTPVQFLRAMVEGVGSQKGVAAILGMSPAYICDVLAGRRDVSEALARKLGYQRIVTYSPIDDDGDAA